MEESSQCFYEKIIPVQTIMIGSVYRKDENYYYKEKYFVMSKKHFDGSEKFQQIKLNL